MIHLSMEKENKDPESWSSTHIHQSQWLQTTISDLDEKLDAMMTILEGVNSPNQEHEPCKRREDLLQMLEEFGQSYRVLAISYNQLKSKTSHGSFHPGSLSSTSTSKTICAICNKRVASKLEGKKLEDSNRRPKSPVEHSDIKLDGTNLGFELFNKQEDECHELLSVEPYRVKLKPKLERRDTQMEDIMTEFSTNENALMKIEDLELNQRIEDPSMTNFEFDNTWSMLKYQVTKLTEDNLQQVVALVQRNDEKRETIRRLQLEVEALKYENNALQISSRHSNAGSECDQPQIPRSGGRSAGMLFRGCSP
ncbi:hypothetical protein VNO77_16679 [Canavalia gladiata]|uniref:NAB domain-containing protein n=1 Tax=Canavalia gladiata TaxID=3824 RepID=A0AAN9LI84_CANGL